MKNARSIIPMAIVMLLLFFSCKKDSDTEQIAITYPDSGQYGLNLLAMPDSAIASVVDDYSFSATLENNVRLLIKLTNLSESPTQAWFFDVSTTHGWQISNFENNSQTFSTVQSGTYDLNMRFLSAGSRGVCRIDFYENSDEITFSKYLFWE